MNITPRYRAQTTFHFSRARPRQRLEARGFLHSVDTVTSVEGSLLQFESRPGQLREQIHSYTGAEM